MKTITAFFLALLAFHTGSLLAAVGFLAAQHWMDCGDLFAFWFWTGVLTVPMLLPAALYAWWAPRNRMFAVIGAVLTGVLLGYAGTLWVVWWMLGPWFGAFGFPVMYCWVLGAVAACVVLTCAFRRRAAVVAGR